MEEKILERLYFHNPWWLTGEISPNLALPFRRKVFSKLWRNFNSDRIGILKGPRRTGKTTLIYQLIQEHLKNGVPPKNILYLSFDDIDLRVRLTEILKVWEREAKKPLDSGTTLYLFLDEVQFLDYWEVDVKLFFDKKYPIKFFASGSSASLIRKTTETLVGRTFEEVLLTLDFEEYLFLTGAEFGLSHETLQALKSGEASFIPYENKLFSLWDKYLERGGFPHLLGLSDEEWRQSLKDDIVDKVLYRDLVQLYGIKEPETLERMFRYLAATSSGILNISGLAANLKMSWESTQNYLSYLEQAYLIFSLPKYSRSPKETARSYKKIHVIDSGLMQIFSEPEKSALWESVTARHFWEGHKHETYYWRDDREVDIVIEENRSLFPIEVKSGSTIEKSEVRGLLDFIEKYKSPMGKVIYSGREKTLKEGSGSPIEFVPVYQLGFNGCSL